MKRLGQYIFFVIIAAALAGCGSSPPVRYYGLAPADVAYQVDASHSAIIGFGPFRVPAYLKRPQIVTRGQGAEINVDDYSRWAEPVDKAIHNVVASNLDGMLGDAVVVGYPYLNALDIEYWIIGRIDRFEADQNGEVVLSVQWGLQDNERQSLVAPQRQSYQARAADVNDPSAIAQAMSDTLAQFSRDVAAQVSAALD